MEFSSDPMFSRKNDWKKERPQWLLFVCWEVVQAIHFRIQLIYGDILTTYNPVLLKTILRKICSKLTIKTSERRQWRRSGVFIINFDQISYIVSVFLLIINFEHVKCRLVYFFALSYIFQRMIRYYKKVTMIVDKWIDV